MMRRIAGMMVLLMFCAACGKSKEEQQADDVKKAADQVQQGATQMAKSLEDAAKGFAGAAGDANAKPVDPVSFQSLVPLLPASPSGWEREEPQGEKTTGLWFGISEAHASYHKGDAAIDLKITDSGLNQIIFAPFVALMSAGYSRESSSGYEKSTVMSNNPGFEKWEKDDKSGSIVLVVGKRFLVEANGHSIDDITPVRTLVERTDLGKLAALK